MTNRRRTIAISVVTLVGVALVRAEQPDSYTFEPLIVQGDRLGRRLYELPQSAAVLDDDSLTGDTSRDAFAVVDRFANTYTGVPADSVLSIRGVGNDSVAPAGFDRTNGLATVFIDDSPLTLSRLDFFAPSLWDARDVTILRGPVSTSYGPNALIGALFVDYAEPDFSPTGKIRVKYAEFESHDVAVTQNLPLIDNKLAVRLNLERDFRAGAVKNVTIPRDDWDRVDKTEVRTQLLWRPQGDDSLRFDVYLDYGEAEALPFYAAIETPGMSLGDRISTHDFDEFSTAETSLSYVKIRYELDDVSTLESISTYNYLNINDRSDLDASHNPFVHSTSFTDEARVDQELRWRFRYDSVSLLAGAYYQRHRFEFGFDGTGMAPGLPSKATNATDTRVETSAIFTESTIQLNEKCHIDAGLRFNYEDRETRNVNIVDGFGGAVRGSGDDFTILPRAGITYDIDRNLSVGSLASLGYRSGGVSSALLLNRVEAYDPEFAWNYEVFFRYASVAGRFNVGGNIYYMDWRKQQVQVTSEGGLAGFDDILVNAGRSRLYGGELEGRWRMNGTLESFFALGHQSTEFVDFDSSEGDFSGDRFTNAPRWNWAAGIQYGGTHGVFASSTLTWRDQTYASLGQKDRSALEERLLLSGKVGYRTANWELFIFGNNLFDRDFAVKRSDVTAFGLPNTAAAQPNQPRTIGIGLASSW